MLARALKLQSQSQFDGCERVFLEARDTPDARLVGFASHIDLKSRG